MTLYFYNRDPETGKPHTRSGMSAAPHLYTSEGKARAQAPRGFEQVPVLLVDAAKPVTLTREQVQLCLKEANKLGEDVTEDGDVVPQLSFSTVELQMLFGRVLTIAYGNSNTAAKASKPAPHQCRVCGTTEGVEYVGGSHSYLCKSAGCVPF